jgi:bile acid:Na+ symporter, BASS family
VGQINISDYLLLAVIAIIMFNLGLSLKLGDFKKIFEQPGPLIAGLVCQLVLLPAIAFAIAVLAPLPPALKTGIVIIAACPGGATSNLITYLLKGNVALSISLTSINSIIILVSIPLIISFALVHFMVESANVVLPIGNTVLKIFMMILAPTGIGIWARKRNARWAIKAERLMKYTTTALLAVVYAIAVIYNRTDNDWSLLLYWKVTPYVFLLNVLGMFTGFLIGKILC